jgi:predicted lipoprotein with Yx(FWY)xxD motif
MRVTAVPALLTVVALATGCGSAASGSGGGYGASPAPATTASVATIKTAHGSLGTFLVDSRSRTLYLFEKDRRGRSACSGACATAWPPVITTGSPKAGPGVKASFLGTTKRSDGKSQVTYAGHPLYRFSRDTRPGQTAGQGVNAFGAAWYVVAPTGQKIDES